MASDFVDRRLGQYQIVEEIGRGGMAVVYKAYHAALDRYVAIKVLPRERSFDREFVARFMREARSAARLNHPNAVTIYDVGQAEGTYFIVMEYVDGLSLTELVEKQGTLSPERATEIVSQVASALEQTDLSVLPRGMQSVGGKALAKDPRQRYGRATAFAQAWEQALTGEPIAAKREPNPRLLAQVPTWLRALEGQPWYSGSCWLSSVLRRPRCSPPQLASQPQPWLRRAVAQFQQARATAYITWNTEGYCEILAGSALTSALETTNQLQQGDCRYYVSTDSPMQFRYEQVSADQVVVTASRSETQRRECAGSTSYTCYSFEGRYVVERSGNHWFITQESVHGLIETSPCP